MARRLVTLLLLTVSFTLAAIAQEPAADGGPPPGMERARGIGGTVTSVSGTTLNVKNEEGESYQILTSANSRIMKDRQPIKLSEIHVGDIVMAGGELDSKAKTVGAVFVAVLTPEQAQKAKKMREDFGKTWTAGEVTALGELTITVKRRDSVAQTITVDENTSFKKRRESITLADIKVGDRLMAQGGLKGETFVATSVNIGRMGPGVKDEGVKDDPTDEATDRASHHRQSNKRPKIGGHTAVLRLLCHRVILPGKHPLELARTTRSTHPCSVSGSRIVGCPQAFSSGHSRR